MYESITLHNEKSIPTNIRGDDRDGAAQRTSLSKDQYIQPLLDRITTTAGDNITARRALPERDTYIKEIK